MPASPLLTMLQGHLSEKVEVELGMGVCRGGGAGEVVLGQRTGSNRGTHDHQCTMLHALVVGVAYRHCASCCCASQIEQPGLPQLHLPPPAAGIGSG